MVRRRWVMKKTSKTRSSATPKRHSLNGKKPTKAKKAVHPGILFYKNRGAQTYATLRPYGGKVVAWSQDGSRVVDFDDEFDVLVERLRAQGHPVQDFVYERI